MKEVLKTFVPLLGMSQEELAHYVLDCVKGKNDTYEVEFEKDAYIYVTGGKKDIKKPLLTSHLDTINDISYGKFSTQTSKLPEVVIEEHNGMTLISTSNQAVLGADDRSGVWIMLQLILKGVTDYDYVFCFDEEVGGVGSTVFAGSKVDILDQYTCFISLDRRGVDEVATYGYDNQDLIDIFEAKGYKEAMGSFTDCVNMSEKTDIACINLSVGYDKEHTNKETQIVDVLPQMLYILTDDNLIAELQAQTFHAEYNYKYKSPKSKSWNDYEQYMFSDKEPVFCDICGQHAPLYLVNNMMVCNDCTAYADYEEYEWID